MENQAYAEVLRQLPTAELLKRYYQETPELAGTSVDYEEAEEGPITINDVQMSVNDAREYLITNLVQSH
ncbi:MAG: hypothetical protein Q3959_06330 [Limosilactobacillus sp.]|uniref:hypothetical protein n=1 Tax=Limosilactobacillus sp. TaxID=2773925 RepID=UPI002703E905|nr:hypothetical protein [Limosilactobacillus sp.]